MRSSQTSFSGRIEFKGHSKLRYPNSIGHWTYQAGDEDILSLIINKTDHVLSGKFLANSRKYRCISLRIRDGPRLREHATPGQKEWGVVFTQSMGSFFLWSPVHTRNRPEFEIISTGRKWNTALLYDPLCNRIWLAWRGKSINPADMSLPLSTPILLHHERKIWGSGMNLLLYLYRIFESRKG